ncbi:MAG: hypothetical protein FWF05_08525 [Oscillospiraceae bacterium]|nr:hypothetical protein [Oscillospiraceae bacterium]
MAINYTERELNQMREQAIKNAREMHRRAVPPNTARLNGSMDNTRGKPPAPQRVNESSGAFTQRMTQNTAAHDPDREKQERLNRLVEEVIREASANAESDAVKTPDIDDRFVPPNEIFGGGETPAPPPAPSVSAGKNRKLPVNGKDNDVMFILSIIIILLREKADFMLIFAMMYILM